MFTVDSEFEIGNRRIPNEEVAEAAAANADMMMAFASIDPHKGKMGVREARALIEVGVIKGFKFHPTVQGFFPNDRMALADVSDAAAVAAAHAKIVAALGDPLVLVNSAGGNVKQRQRRLSGCRGARRHPESKHDKRVLVGLPERDRWSRSRTACPRQSR